MEQVFVDGFIPKKPKYDFIVANLHIKIDDFEKWLKENKDLQSNGWLTSDVMKSKKDNSKYYAKVTKFEKKERSVETSANSHKPDREDDLPF